MNSLGLSTSINYVLVFTEGLVSFFSPCVIPLIPLYMAYLAGGTREKDIDGNVSYARKTIVLHTVFFILGISTAFFILGLGFSSLSLVLKEYRDFISKIGGAIIIILGLNQLGVLKIKFLSKQIRFNKKTNTQKMNPLTAFVMGFGFSFAWTPCVGPALASVLILASNAKSVLEGNILVLIYVLGFLIPFVVLGLFTGETLNFIKKNPKIMDILVKIGAVVLLVMGVLMMSGKLETLEAEVSKNQSREELVEDSQKNEVDNKEDMKESDETEEKKHKMLPIELKDQNGRLINIEKDYKGKVVFLNFFATWCPPCRKEIPDIEKLYQDNGYNKKDIVVIAVASPGQGREQDEEGLKSFIKNMNITYPVLMDTSGEVFGKYQVYSLPTSFLIDRESNIYGYITGSISREQMDKAIEETKAQK